MENKRLVIKLSTFNWQFETKIANVNRLAMDYAVKKVAMRLMTISNNLQIKLATEQWNFSGFNRDGLFTLPD